MMNQYQTLHVNVHRGLRYMLLFLYIEIFFSIELYCFVQNGILFHELYRQRYACVLLNYTSPRQCLSKCISETPEFCVIVKINMPLHVFLLVFFVDIEFMDRLLLNY